MEKKDEPEKPAINLFWKTSGLRRFRNKHQEQFKTLTEREIEVLTLIADGLQNSDVAKKLSISSAMVQNDRTSIRKKLTINSRAEYIKYAFAYGLISF